MCLTVDLTMCLDTGMTTQALRTKDIVRVISDPKEILITGTPAENSTEKRNRLARRWAKHRIEK